MNKLDEITNRLQEYVQHQPSATEGINTHTHTVSSRLPKIHIRMFHEFIYDPNTDTRTDIKGPFMNVVSPGGQLKYPNRGKKSVKGEEAKIIEDEVI